MIGQLLSGRYQILQTLGAGGMAQTFIAEDIHRPDCPKCVVKQLKPINNNIKFLATARNLFQREANILGQLGDHPQIPRLLAHFEQDEEFYLVQDFIEGATLTAQMQPGQRWSEPDVIQMLREILKILEFVHSKNIIHRDIKPDNVIRRPDGSLVLIDFGAVKHIQAQLTTIAAQPSIAVGTYGYMPTEQAQGRPRPNSDLYALGMMSIQALTGLLPTQLPEDPDTGEILWQHFVAIDSKLGAILSKMVRYHFKDRYRSATEVLEALESLKSPLSSEETIINPIHPLAENSTSVSEALPPAKNIQKRWRRIGAGLALALVGAISFGAVKGILQAQTAYGGDGQLDIGVLNTPNNKRENYQALIDHLQSQLGKRTKIAIHFIEVKENAADAFANARKKIKAKEWDVAFTTLPLLSATAVDNNFEFAARMFPQASSIQAAIFVRQDSPIQSLEQLNANHKIALGGFDNAALFYMAVYDLYGETLQVDLNNNIPQIIAKVESKQVDVGVGIYQLIQRQKDKFRVLNVSKDIPISGVYLSPRLDKKEKASVKQALLAAPEGIKKQARYGAGKEFDYTQFKKITQRVEQVTNCTNWQENPVKLFCPEIADQPKQGIVGKINGFRISSIELVYLTLQAEDNKIYRVTLPRKVLNQDPDLPPLSGWNGKTVQIENAEVKEYQGLLEVEINQPGQIKIVS